MKLRLIHPKIGEFSFRLEDGPALILGRCGADADLELSWDPRVSRRHARISLRDGEVWLEDLGSKNGCWLGRERLLGAARLEAGAVVVLGETALLVPESVSEQSESTIDGLVAAELFEASGAQRPEPETGDLRGPPDLGPVSVRSPCAAARLVREDLIEVRAESQKDLRRLWREELCRGGFLVETETPPGRGVTLEVKLKAPQGDLRLSARVRQIFAAEGASKELILVELLEPSPDERRALEAYLEGGGLRSKDGHSPEDPAAREEALERARTLLEAAELQDLYGALGLWPSAQAKLVAQRAAALRTLFLRARPEVSPPQAARLQAAERALDRLEKVLTSRTARLEYDFRRGLIRAEERLAAAHRSGEPSLAELRMAWQRVFPEKFDQAAALARAAFVERQNRRFESAIEAARKALALNPFFDELRRNVEVWEERVAERPKG